MTATPDHLDGPDNGGAGAAGQPPVSARRGTRPRRAQPDKAPGPVTARRLVLVPPHERHGAGGKVIGVANAGRPVGVGIALPDTRHHIAVQGPTGTGKSSVLLRMALDDAVHGRGLAVFDPKGDLIRDLLDRLPADCSDRLVIIDPDETSAPPALNLLDPANSGGSAYEAAAHVTSVMAKVWSRWWGHRTADIAHHALLTLADIPGSTLAQLPRLLADGAWRAACVARVTARLDPWAAASLAEFWAGYDELSAGGRAAVVAPLLAKLRLVLAHPLAANLFGVPATTFTLPDILDGGILLVRLPKGSVGEDGCRLIGSLLLAGLWQATTARARIPETARLDAAIYVDECHNFLHLPIGIDDALAEARGLRVSFTLAHQYLGQLSTEMADAIDANARNKVYFALAPGDAVTLARHVAPYLDAGDLTRLGGFEAVLRPVCDGRAAEPVTVDTLPPPRAIPGRAQALREAARRHTGLPAQIRRRLLAEQHTAPTPQNPPPQPLVPGRDTFLRTVPNTRGAKSNEKSNEESNEDWPGGQHSAEHAPMDTPNPQAGGGEPR